MGKKDIVTKRYLSNNDKFADIFNYYIYGGKQVILPQMLEDDNPEELMTQMFPDGDILAKGKMRDLLKRCIVKKEKDVTYILLGAESAAEVHYALPVKNGLYDFIDYTTQVEKISKEHRKKRDLRGAEFLSGFAKDDKIKPIITLTVYFGTDEWDGPLSLHQMFNTEDKEILKYVDDYKVNLIVPKNIHDSEKFTTDFRDIVDFMKAAGNKTALKELIDRRREEFANMEPETAMVLKECANVEIKIDEREEKTNMCRAIDEMMEDARKEGIETGKKEMCKALKDMAEEAREEGREQGRQEAQTKDIIKTLIICKELGIDRQTVTNKIAEKYSLTSENALSIVEANW